MARVQTPELVRQAIRTVNNAAGETYSDLARLLSVSVSGITRRQRGEFRWSDGQLAAVAARYGITVDDLRAGPTVALAAYQRDDAVADRREDLATDDRERSA